MLNDYLNRPRRKAWLGAAIGAAATIGSAIFGASQQKKAQEKQYILQNNMNIRNTGLTSAANLTQAFSNADEVDKEFRSRFLRCGGRRKAEGGTEVKTTGYSWTNADTNSIINSLGSVGSNIAKNIIGQGQQQVIYPNAIKPIQGQDANKDVIYDSAARSEFLNRYYQTMALRMGGHKRKC